MIPIVLTDVEYKTLGDNLRMYADRAIELERQNKELLSIVKRFMARMKRGENGLYSTDYNIELDNSKGHTFLNGVAKLIEQMEKRP